MALDAPSAEVLQTQAGGSGRKRSGRKGSFPARAGVRQGRADPVAPVSRPGHREPLRHAAAGRRDARGLGRPPRSRRGQALLRGSAGRVHSWVWKENDLRPTCVYVKFDGATWQLDGAPEPGLYPVYPARKVWKLDAKRKKPVLKIARTQLPLAPAYAITAHGSQGKTLPAALVDFNVDKRTDVTFGTVAASRVRSREDVLILAPDNRAGEGGKRLQGVSRQAFRALALHPRRAGGPGAPAEAATGRGSGLGRIPGGEGALRGVREMQRGQDTGLLLRSAVGARQVQPLGHLPCLRPRQGRPEDAEAEAAV